MIICIKMYALGILSFFLIQIFFSLKNEFMVHFQQLDKLNFMILISWLSLEILLISKNCPLIDIQKCV